MTKFSELKKGDVLSESQYYKVEKTSGSKVQLLVGDQHIVVTKDYVESFLSSADQFNEAEKMNKTKLAELFINSPRIALTVAFYKQDKKKTKKAYKEELVNKAEEVKEDFLKRGLAAIEDALANPVSEVIPGELRVMRGRHYGEVDDMGRIKFVDMDIEGENNMRVVDPRTIQYLIVNNVKYVLK